MAGRPTSNVIEAFETVPLFSNYQEGREDYEEAVPGSLDTRWRGAGAHLHGEGATVGSGALEATRLHFPAQVPHKEHTLVEEEAKEVSQEGDGAGASGSDISVDSELDYFIQ